MSLSLPRLRRRTPNGPDASRGITISKTRPARQEILMSGRRESLPTGRQGTRSTPVAKQSLLRGRNAPNIPYQKFSSFLSERRESNSDYMHPMHAYYHYTTLRKLFDTGTMRLPTDRQARTTGILRPENFLIPRPPPERFCRANTRSEPFAYSVSWATGCSGIFAPRNTNGTSCAVSVRVSRFPSSMCFGIRMIKHFISSGARFPATCLQSA